MLVWFLFSEIILQTMAKARAVGTYLRSGGASNDEIDDFIDFCGYFANEGKTGRYECYRLWARLLRHRRTHYKKYDHFDFHFVLKDYLRHVSKGEIVDADPPSGAVVVPPEDFVKFVVRYLDDAY